MVCAKGNVSRHVFLNQRGSHEVNLLLRSHIDQVRDGLMVIKPWAPSPYATDSRSQFYPWHYNNPYGPRRGSQYVAYGFVTESFKTRPFLFLFFRGLVSFPNLSRTCVELHFTVFSYCIFKNCEENMSYGVINNLILIFICSPLDVNTYTLLQYFPLYLVIISYFFASISQL